MGRLKKILEKRNNEGIKYQDLDLNAVQMRKLKQFNAGYLRKHMNSIGNFKKLYKSVSLFKNLIRENLKEIKEVFNKY